MDFTATVELGGKTATGICVPPEAVAALGPGKRPPVLVTVAGHTYRTTVASMGGRFMVPLSAENRSAAGVAAGEEVRVGIELDSEPREVQVPDDLAAALADAPLRQRFDRLSYTARREIVTGLEQAKTPQTRSRRIAKAVEMLQAVRTG